jgi:hypothetical protein
MAKGVAILPLREAKRYRPFVWVPQEQHRDFYEAAGEYIYEAPAEDFPQLGRIAVIVEMEPGNEVYYPFVMGSVQEEPLTPVNEVS